MTFFNEITDMFRIIGEFFAQVFDLLDQATVAISRTTVYIDSVHFNNSLFYDYLGYAHYAMGTPLYIATLSISYVSVGVIIWRTLLLCVGYIKNMLPW